MKVLGVFLKIIGILIIVAGTLFSVFVALDAAILVAYLVMGASEIAFWIIGLCFFGLGSACSRIVSLEKRVAQLERAATSAAAVVPAAEGAEAAPAKDTESAAPAAASETVLPQPKKKKSKVWIPILIVVVVLVIAAVIGGLLFIRSFVADQLTPEISIEDEFLPDDSSAEEAPVPEIPVQQFVLGDTLSTDFFTMSFDDYVVAADVKHSVTTGYVTRITGPEPLPGQKYICLSGSIQNTSTSPLPVYDFFIGNFELDGYNYEVSANDIDILDGEGQTKSEIDPLMVYNYRLYVAIPDALADSYSSCNFTFGFFDGFENQELAYIRSFEENPISHCPYQYDVTLK